MNSLIGFLIDKSGSMQNSEAGVIQGFNDFLAMQQQRLDDCTLVAGQFGDYYYKTHDFVSIFEVAPMKPADYQPNGSTAMYEAIVAMCKDIDNTIAPLPKDQKPTNITIVIQTDGGNTGGSWSPQQLNDLYRAKKALGWRFIAFAEAGSEEYQDLTQGQFTADPSGTDIKYGRKGYEQTMKLQGMGWDKSDVHIYRKGKIKEMFDEVGHEVMLSVVTGAHVGVSDE